MFRIFILAWRDIYVYQIYAVARTEMSTASYASTMSKQNMIDCKIDLRC